MGCLCFLARTQGYKKSSALTKVRRGRLDPCFHLQMYTVDRLHPRSPLGTPSLVQRILFGDVVPMHSIINDFMPKMAEFEVLPFSSFRFKLAGSHAQRLAWPFQMIFKSFASCRRILANMRGGHVLIIAGSQDKSLGPIISNRTAGEAGEAAPEPPIVGEGPTCGYRIVNGAGHHLQNDVQRDEGARYVLDWLNSVYM